MPQAQTNELQRRKLHNGDKLAPLSRFVTVARAAAPAEPDGDEAAAPAAPSVPGLDMAARTLQISFASEAPVERWFGNEVLSMDAGAPDLSRLNDGAPLLFNHDMDDVIGVVERAWLGGDGKAYAEVRFANNARGNEVLALVAEGVLRNVSFMYQVDQYRIDSDESDPYYDPDATYTATSWLAYEISIVSVPADQTVGVGRSLASPETSVTVVSRSGLPLPTATADNLPTIGDPMKRKYPLQEAVVEQRSTGGAAAPAAALAATPNDDRLSWAETEASIRALEKRFGHAELATLLIETKAPITEVRAAYMAATGNGGQRPVASPVADMSAREVKSYSLVRAVAAAASGDWSKAGFEREVSIDIRGRLERNPEAPKPQSGNSFFIPNDLPFAPDEAHLRAWRMAGGGAALAQVRAAYQVGSGTGGNLVATNLLADNFIEVLRNASVTAQLGARFLTGLVGNIQLPRQTGQTSTYWVGESGAITEAEATFDKLSLSFKTIAALSKMSRQMLMQSTPAIEMLAREDLIAVMALGLDLATLSGSGSSNQPTGILNTAGIGSVVGGTNGANLTFDHIIALKATPKIANAPQANLGFALNSKCIAYLETLKSTTGSYLWSNGGAAEGAPDRLKGYPYAESQQLRSTLTKGSASTCSELLFGNWREVIVAEWGVTELMVNPYSSTEFANGDVLIRAFQSADVGLRHTASFAAMTDALTPGF